MKQSPGIRPSFSSCVLAAERAFVNRELLPTILSLQEIEQKLNCVACLCHLASEVRVIIEGSCLDSTKLQLLP